MNITNMNHPKCGQLIAALIITLALAAICLGCKSTVANYNPKTGDWSISDRRVFLKTEADVTASVETNGTRTITIKAKSDPQADAFKAIAEGAASGAAKFLKP